MKFKISLPEGKSDQFKKGADGLLEKYKIMYSGRKGYNNKLMILLYELRPKIGAHSSGRTPTNRAQLRIATDLINELFDKEIDSNQVQHYMLSIDSD